MEIPPNLAAKASVADAKLIASRTGVGAAGNWMQRTNQADRHTGFMMVDRHRRHNQPAAFRILGFAVSVSIVLV